MTTLADNVPFDKSALELVKKLGRPILPIHSPMNDGRCSCEKLDCARPGKHPRTPHGYKDATVDKSQIQEWGDKWPDANIAIPTGVQSDLCVLEFDLRHGGYESMKELEHTYGAFPTTVEALSGGGGRHIYFRHPGGHLKSRTGDNAISPGAELIAEGGYIIAPRSLHISGCHYEWECCHHPEVVPITQFPEWLLKLIYHQQRDKAKRSSIEDIARGVHEGYRNVAATRIVGKFLGAMDCTSDWEKFCWPILRGWNSLNRPPLSESELRRVFEKIASREASKRSHIQTCHDATVAKIVTIAGETIGWRALARRTGVSRKTLDRLRKQPMLDAPAAGNTPNKDPPTPPPRGKRATRSQKAPTEGDFNFKVAYFGIRGEYQGGDLMGYETIQSKSDQLA